MAKNKGGGNNGNKAAGTNITGSAVLDPSKIGKDGKAFHETMGECAVVAGTLFVSTGVMFGLNWLGGKLFGRFFKDKTGTTQQPAVAQARQQSDDKPDAQEIIKYCKLSKDKLEAEESEVSAPSITDMVLEYNPELAPHIGMVKGIANNVIAGKV